MATLCTCRHEWLVHAKGGLGGGCSIEDCPCAGFKAGAPSHIFTPGSSKEDLVAKAEAARAVDLWARVVTIWESDDGPTKAHDPEILERIAGVIDEWHGFAGVPKADAASAEEEDDDSAFAFIAHEGLVDEYNAWCERAPEREQQNALFKVWWAERKAAQAAAGCTHPDGEKCLNCDDGGFAAWLAKRNKQAMQEGT